MKMKKSGFTLIEVMTVVAIIIILTTVASFSGSEYITRSRNVSSRAATHVNKYNAARIQVDALNLASPETTTPTPDPDLPTEPDITETNADDRCDVVFVNWNGTQLSIQSIFIGQAADAPANPMRAGWTFTEWDVAFDNITGPLTITAVFSQNTYTVQFVDYDGTTVLKTQDVNGGDSATAPASPTRTGYTFTGWDPATFTDISANLTVTAQYSITLYAVTFDSAGGSAVGSITQPSGTTVTAPATPTRAGYTFAGWSPAVPATMPIGGAALTAQWTVSSYTITFNSNGGSAVSSITQNFGTAVTAPPNPTRTGYIFAGWSPAVPATMPNDGATLTAQWTANKYTVTFVDGFGVTLKTQTEVPYGTAATPPTNPTKTGYTFSSWSPAYTNITANLTVTAQWKFDVKFYRNRTSTDTNVTATLTVTSGNNYVLPTSPTWTSHTFLGWFTAKSGGSQVTTATIVSVNDVIKLYAHWS